MRRNLGIIQLVKLQMRAKSKLCNNVQECVFAAVNGNSGTIVLSAVDSAGSMDKDI